MNDQVEQAVTAVFKNCHFEAPLPKFGGDPLVLDGCLVIPRSRVKDEAELLGLLLPASDPQKSAVSQS